MSRDTPNQPGAWPVSIARSGLAMDESGLCLGTFPLLSHECSDQNEADRERLLMLLSVAYRRPVGAHILTHIEAAANHWRTGDKALANLRLAYANLPALDDVETADRLRLANGLLDGGLTPRALIKTLDLDTDGLERRYNPNQPRVPAGNGHESGRWAALWNGLTAWLAEPVPEYDHDTGEEVGTRSRGYAIATNPLTIIAGAAALLGAEALLPEAIAAELSAAVEPEALSPFSQRYLSTSGGRLGGTKTRQQLYEIATDYVKSGKYKSFKGDGLGPEEYIPGPSGHLGGTYVDFTAKISNNSCLRIQTIDTLADGVTPTAYEARAAARIRLYRPDDELILIPKRTK